jgi:hypothetical protein
MVKIIFKCYRLTEKWDGIKVRKELYNSKTPWNRVFVETLTGPQHVKKLSTFVGTPRFIISFTSATNLSLSRGRSV